MKRLSFAPSHVLAVIGARFCGKLSPEALRGRDFFIFFYGSKLAGVCLPSRPIFRCKYGRCASTGVLQYIAYCVFCFGARAMIATISLDFAMAFFVLLSVSSGWLLLQPRTVGCGRAQLKFRLTLQEYL